MDVVDELRYMIVQMVKFAVGLHHHLGSVYESVRDGYGAESGPKRWYGGLQLVF